MGIELCPERTDQAIEARAWAFGLEFRVWGLGFRASGLGFRAYWYNGKENGNYHSILGSHRDNGRENGNYHLGSRVSGLGFRAYGLGFRA